MLADDIVDLLSSGGLGTAATDLFVGELPDDVTTGIQVRETGGLGTVHTMGGVASTGLGAGAATVEQPRFQIISRAASYATARANMSDAFHQLDGLRERTVNGVRYLWVSAVQSPFDLGRDLNGRSRFAVNFDVVKALSTSTST